MLRKDWLEFVLPMFMVLAVATGMLTLAARLVPSVRGSASSQDHARKVISRIEEGSLNITGKKCADLLRAGQDYQVSLEKLIAWTLWCFLFFGSLLVLALLLLAWALWRLHKKWPSYQDLPPGGHPVGA